MKLELTRYLVPVVGGCMKTVQRIESWMMMDKSDLVHTALCNIHFTEYIEISFLESAGVFLIFPPYCVWLIVCDKIPIHESEMYCCFACYI